MAPSQLRAAALRGCLRASRTTTTPARMPATFAASRFYATDVEPKKPAAAVHQSNETKVGRTFQGQVMGSIGSRLRREREQREQYEEWRNMTDPSRNWVMTFGEYM